VHKIITGFHQSLSFLTLTYSQDYSQDLHAWDSSSNLNKAFSFSFFFFFFWTWWQLTYINFNANFIISNFHLTYINFNANFIISNFHLNVINKQIGLLLKTKILHSAQKYYWRLSIFVTPYIANSRPPLSIYWVQCSHEFYQNIIN